MKTYQQKNEGKKRKNKPDILGLGKVLIWQL